MNQTRHPDGPERSAPGTLASIPGAKACLLTWAAETDARTRMAQAGVGTIAAGAALALFGGMAVGCVLTPRRPRSTSGTRVERAGRPLISWELAARAGVWLLPYAIRAVQSK